MHGTSRVTGLTADMAVQRVSDLVALDEAVWSELGALYSESPWAPRNFLKHLPCKWQNSAVALDAREIIGFWIASDRGPLLHAHRIAVRRKARHKGIGSSLFQWVRATAETTGFKGIALHVPKGNERATSFYRHLGFVPGDAEGRSGLRPDLFPFDPSASHHLYVMLFS